MPAKSVIDIVLSSSKEERVVRVQFSRRIGFVLVMSAIVGVLPAAAQTDGGQSQPPSPPPPQVTVQATSPPSSPLAIHVGDADLLIGGFLDAMVISRSTNTGNGIATNFGAIPFKTTAGGAPNPAGNLSETRFSAQNSRLSLQATSKVGSANLKGYVEVDFLGNTSTNFNVTSNANTLRMRLYWAQYTEGKFEFTAGQSWSMMTPGRNGISPVPGDIFFSQNVDTNYQNGLTWGRELGFRFIVHPSSTVTAGFGLENPQQYVGSAVVLPAAFPAAEVDQGASAVGSSSSVPNRYPDIIGKIAFDPKMKKTHQHIDAAFLIRGYRTFMPSSNTKYSATGKAGSINVALELVPNVRFVAMNYFSDGGGRYISNANIPDFIVNADGSMKTVSSWSGIYGAEATKKKTLVYGYYSLANADALTAFDANGTTPIGFGVANSQSANHKVEEDTFGLTETLFRDPKIGGLQLQFQYSYVKRTVFSSPQALPTGTLPGNVAKTNMFYVNFRYILP
jgi:hypothetical protein